MDVGCVGGGIGCAEDDTGGVGCGECIIGNGTELVRLEEAVCAGFGGGGECAEGTEGGGGGEGAGHSECAVGCEGGAIEAGGGRLDGGIEGGGAGDGVEGGGAEAKTVGLGEVTLKDGAVGKCCGGESGEGAIVGRGLHYRNCCCCKCIGGGCACIDGGCKKCSCGCDVGGEGRGI